ncbi:type II secretion system F family protein [Candidatus Pyrohabitans sp.]
MANVIVRLIEKIGELTVTRAESVAKRAQEISFALSEQEEAAKKLQKKKEKEREERKRAIEEKLLKLRETVALEDELPSEETFEIVPEREELREPFATRLVNIISELFSGYERAPSSFFANIQEDLYKANIIMPASKYVAFAMGASVIVAITSAVIFSLVFAATLGALGSLIGLVLGPLLGVFTFFYARIYPKSKVKARTDAFSRELPFALRHMATQLTSGAGLLETMRSVAQSGYGVLSEEFRRAIQEIERGATIEEAYDRMNLRIDSPGLKKASRQIISTLRTGGNLANTLKIIAEEVATEMRMKLKDYIQILNTFSLMYMFAIVVAPVLITTLVIAMGIAMKGLPISANVMWMLYFAFFGVGIYMSFMVKRFEPKV